MELYAFNTRAVCPVCSAREYTILADLPYDRPPISDYIVAFYRGRIDPARLSAGRYTLAECADCGLVFQREVPAPDFIAALYGGQQSDAREEVGRGRGLRVRQAYSFQVEQLVKYFGGDPSSIDVLDYGSGWGLWLQMAAAYGCRTAAAELPGAQAAEMSRLGHELCDLDALPAQRFHFINAEQVFEHLLEPCEALESIVAALRPRGIVRISVPNGHGVAKLLEDPDWTAPKGTARSLNSVAPLEHVNCFRNPSLLRLVSAARLELFTYPVRQFFDSWERARFAASALLHELKPPRGTMLLFQESGAGSQPGRAGRLTSRAKRAARRGSSRDLREG